MSPWKGAPGIIGTYAAISGLTVLTHWLFGVDDWLGKASLLGFVYMSYAVGLVAGQHYVRKWECPTTHVPAPASPS